MAQPWSGVVLSSARLNPADDIDLRLIKINYVAAPVRKIDERTVEYSEEPITVRVRLAYGDDPWVRSVDPALYQRWVQELGTEPVSFLICTTKYFSDLTEYLHMHLAHEMQVAHKDSRVAGWDFQVNDFIPDGAIEVGIDWHHVIAVIQGREERYGPNNPNPAFMTPEEINARYEAQWPKKRRFWRRGLFSFEAERAEAAERCVDMGWLTAVSPPKGCLLKSLGPPGRMLQWHAPRQSA